MDNIFYKALMIVNDKASEAGVFTYTPFVITNDFQKKVFFNALEEDFNVGRIDITRNNIKVLDSGFDKLFSFYNLYNILHDKYNDVIDAEFHQRLGVLVADMTDELETSRIDSGFDLKTNETLRDFFTQINGNDYLIERIFNSSNSYKISDLVFHFYFSATGSETKSMIKDKLISRIINENPSVSYNGIYNGFKESLFSDAKREFEEKYL